MERPLLEFQYKRQVLYGIHFCIFREDILTFFGIQTWLPDFIMGINHLGTLITWAVSAEVTFLLYLLASI